MNDQQQPSPEDPADRQKLWEHQQRTYDLNQRHAERAHDANTEFFNRTTRPVYLGSADLLLRPSHSGPGPE
jgi:hypothetical protein